MVVVVVVEIKPHCWSQLGPNKTVTVLGAPIVLRFADDDRIRRLVEAKIVAHVQVRSGPSDQVKARVMRGCRTNRSPMAFWEELVYRLSYLERGGCGPSFLPEQDKYPSTEQDKYPSTQQAVR